MLSLKKPQSIKERLVLISGPQICASDFTKSNIKALISSSLELTRPLKESTFSCWTWITNL
ncbi:unnamed protein product, partial [Ilex paraguariensis]